MRLNQNQEVKHPFYFQILSMSKIYVIIVIRKMLEKKPDFVKKLQEFGVKYTRVMPDGDDPSSAIGRGWQSTYGTHVKEDAEKKITEVGGVTYLTI